MESRGSAPFFIPLLVFDPPPQHPPTYKNEEKVLGVSRVTPSSISISLLEPKRLPNERRQLPNLKNRRTPIFKTDRKSNVFAVRRRGLSSVANAV